MAVRIESRKTLVVDQTRAISNAIRLPVDTGAGRLCPVPLQNLVSRVASLYRLYADHPDLFLFATRGYDLCRCGSGLGLAPTPPECGTLGDREDRYELPVRQCEAIRSAREDRVAVFVLVPQRRTYSCAVQMDRSKQLLLFSLRSVPKSAHRPPPPLVPLRTTEETEWLQNRLRKLVRDPRRWIRVNRRLVKQFRWR
ncbi:hypothetical protein GBAR_LOCUS10541 [Geodia barretti]|uniref:Uncharacterized protein n=1 Tax=Geodia barretti TaxID=519541 RepID=A0AA35WDH2_GEOBA|nr:hypothetical protein GBAR_LOCUS10541 [Geodia barretti]